MNPELLRKLVQDYIHAYTKKEAYTAFCVLEFHLLAHWLNEYTHKNGGKEPPKDYEHLFDFRSAAETAIMLHGGEIWHDDD